MEDDIPVKRRESPIPAHPASSQPEPLQDRKPKREEAASNDAAMAARLQAEYDAMQAGRSRRATAPARKPKAKKRKTKSASDLDSDGEPKKKKRGGGGGGAFNAPMLLRCVGKEATDPK